MRLGRLATTGSLFDSAGSIQLVRFSWAGQQGEPAGSRAVYGILNARSNDFGYRHLTYVSISRFLALMHCNMGHGTMEARSVHGS